ncbi:MAG TPA: hypothetical protein VNG71_09950, partial [Pyrinomonadaceae bacterium]|nr:hypothetical protein [Pyrinomonadaceae bacterium]
MSDLVFHRVPGADSLYSGGTSGSVALYYQSLSGNPLGDAPNAGTVWDSDEGCWFWTGADKAIANPATFKQNLSAVLGQVQPGSKWLAWIANPNSPLADLTAELIIGGNNARLISILKSSNYQLISPTAIPFGNLGVNIPLQSTVVLDTNAWQFQITQPDSRTAISLQGTVNTQDIGPSAV